MESAPNTGKYALYAAMAAGRVLLYLGLGMTTIGFVISAAGQKSPAAWAVYMFVIGFFVAGTGLAVAMLASLVRLAMWRPPRREILKHVFETRVNTDKHA